MLSYIVIEGLEFYAYHGVYETEKKIGTDFEIDLKLGLDLMQAAKTDNLKHTVNYENIVKVVQQEMAISSQLIEHVAHRIVQKIKQEFSQIQTVEIKLSKKKLAMGCKLKQISVLMTS